MPKARVNVCDRLCPVTALLGVEVRTKNPGILDAKGQPSFTGVLSAFLSGNTGVVKQGFEGANQAMYAASQCSSRQELEAAWQPSDRCVGESHEIAQRLQPFKGELTEREAVIVGRVGLGPNLTLQPGTTA